MRHSATRELFDYWDALRGARAVPVRGDIDLAAIRGLIADMFMLDIDAAHLFPFVLSGTRVNALACTEQNGRPFVDLWAPQERRNVAALLLTVIDAACPLIVAVGANPLGWQDHEIEILLLPLGRRGQDRGRILGLIVPSTPPSWLGLLPVQNLTLRSVQTILGAAPAGLELAPRFRASASVQGQSWDDAGRNVRHLRVFPGGRDLS